MEGFYIRKNTKELRKQLENLGYIVCKCAEFEDSFWLDVCYIKIKDCSDHIAAHGVGFVDKELCSKTQKELLEDFETSTNDTDCGTDEELFLALAALLASEELTHSDYYCWFTNGSNFVQIVDKRKTKLLVEDIVKKANYHKASEKEIIEYFKNKQ